MNDELGHREHISDYERAVCYYTIPRTTSPVTLALILVYALCLFEALAAMIYGLIVNDSTWTTAGTACLAGIIVLGLVAFTARAFQNEIRRRRALVAAEQTPEPEDIPSDLPDPFATHILWARPLEEPDDNLFSISDRDGAAVYRVHIEDGGALRRVCDAEGHEVLRVKVHSRGGSFVLEGMLPSRADVFAGEDLTGRLKRRFTLGASILDIECRGSQPVRYALKDGGIYKGVHLVGRIYHLRDSLYLDMEKRNCHDVLLGLFASLSFEKAHAPLF